MRHSLFFTSVLAVLAVGVTSCNHEKKTLSGNDIVNYISTYPEVVDIEDNITIGLAQGICQFADSTKADESLRFSPGVTGKCSLRSERYMGANQNAGAEQYIGEKSIVFTPKEGSLKQGKQYTATLDLARLTGIEKLDPFVFNFYVKKREVTLTDIVVTPDMEDDAKAEIKGILTFSHLPQGYEISNDIISVSGEKCSVWIDGTENVEGLHYGNRNQYNFSIKGIARPAGGDREVEIVCDPGAKFAIAKVIASIPTKKGFKLISAEVNDGVEPYVALNFNKFLSKTQSLEGLVGIDCTDIVRIEKEAYTAKVYFKNTAEQKFKMTISGNVRSADDETLQSDIVKEFALKPVAPQVVIPAKGTILPDESNLKLPFRAVNLAAVDVEVVKIYTNNILKYLQDGGIDDTYDYRIRRVGRLIYRQTVRLDTDKSLNLHDWQNFSIDLKGLFKQEKGAIYNIRLTFRKAYSLYGREKPDEFELQSGVTAADDSYWDEKGYYYGDDEDYEDYNSRSAPDYNWKEYNWSEEDDPTKPSYYMSSERMPQLNVVASNLGLIVKKADDRKILATVTDIVTTAPLGGVAVTAYNYQLQPIGSASTDNNGFVEFNARNKPFIVTASHGNTTTYLKIDYGYELSTSDFSVSGTRSEDGIKGFTYGERGVWRPGDDIYLNIIVEDKLHKLPANHPVVMELSNPGGQTIDRQVSTNGKNGLYSFKTRTSDDAETGMWVAEFTVGGKTFRHPVLIETIKPNRLKVNIDLPAMVKSSGTADMTVESQWLSGGAASGLNVKAEVEYSDDARHFSNYPGYVFRNPFTDVWKTSASVLDASLDANGEVRKNIQLPDAKNAPGMLKANFIVHVQEAGGDESIGTRSISYSPYKSYVGVKLGQETYETDKDLKLSVVNLDEDGQPLNGGTLAYKIYKMSRSWWWEESTNIYNSINTSHSKEIKSGQVTVAYGKAEIPFKVDYPEWGTYILYVEDKASGHATGGSFYVDWPSWRDRSDREDADAATVLTFSLDKSEYEVGETASVFLPKANSGRVLVSVENGNKVLSRRWVTLSQDKETICSLEVTKDMAPNFYVHAMLLQPHAQTANDLPIRMYGIQGASVVNRNSILHPVISMPDRLQPQTEFTVKVSEKDGKPMAYTLAIVDEGLLDITSFRTPAPWTKMNEKEALGVDTWDMYKDVIGAFAGKFRNVLSIGGDGDGSEFDHMEAKNIEKRFNPVVKFIGPFTLEAGKSNTHRLSLPMYTGSVRVMVVAAYDGGFYGNADKTVKVNAPLMMLPSMTRTLNCGDKVNLPINVMVDDKAIGNVELTVNTSGPLSVIGKARTYVSASSGSNMASFSLECSRNETGPAKIFLTAKRGGRTVRDTIDIKVNNPQPKVYGSKSHIVNAGSSQTVSWNKTGTGYASLEVSTMPAVDFTGTFSYIYDYDHYCTEQLCSKALNMLFARRFLSAEDQAAAEQAIPEILTKIATRQKNGGGFRYWPTSSDPEPWVTSMAGEVMLEAKRQGFTVQKDVLDKWKSYQKSNAKDAEDDDDLTQAYRIYTLALAGDAPKAAMNKMLESRKVSQPAWLRLAAAYSLNGQDKVAAEMVQNLPESFLEVTARFNSELRNTAFNMDSWLTMGRIAEAIEEAKKVSEKFGRYRSTQEIAFTSIAMSHLADILGSSASDIVIEEEGKSPISIGNLKGAQSVKLTPENGKCTVQNNGSGNIYIMLSTISQPAADETADFGENKFNLSVSYTKDGNPVDISKLKQGCMITASISVSGNYVGKNIALTYNVPSGWEIWNDRLYSDKSDKVDHADIRDDKVIWYFSTNGSARTFSVKLRPAYEGTFILPSAVCEDMYRPEYRAATKPRRVDVVK